MTEQERQGAIYWRDLRRSARESAACLVNRSPSNFSVRSARNRPVCGAATDAQLSEAADTLFRYFVLSSSASRSFMTLTICTIVRFVTSHAHTPVAHGLHCCRLLLMLTAAFIPVPVARPTVQMPPMLNANVDCIVHTERFGARL